MANELNTSSNTNNLYEIFGKRINTIVDINLDIIKSISLSPDSKAAGEIDEIAELFVALEDASFRSEMIEAITRYVIEKCAYAYRSGSSYPNYRTPIVDAAIFLQTVSNFLTAPQTLMLAQYMLKTRTNAGQKGQAR